MKKVSDLSRDIKEFLRDERAYYKSFEVELAEENLSILKRMDVLHLIGIAAFAVSANLINPEFSLNYFVTTCFILQLIYCWGIRFYTKKYEVPYIKFEALFLILSALVISFIIGSCIFAHPQQVGVTFFSTIIAISFLYRVPSVIIVPVLTLYTIVFLILTWQFKTYDVAILDTKGALLAYVIGLMGVYTTAQFNITEYKSKKQLEKLSSIDSLTQIYNKSFFTKQCETYLEQKEVRGYSALFIMDLDNFKQVNDTYGHKKGDYVLSEFGKLIKNLLEQEGSNVLAGRFGGDEFVLFFKEVKSISLVEKYAYDILSSTKGLNKELDNIHISCSIGIAISEEAEESYEKLFYEADKALYESKNSGKNTMTINRKKRKIG